MKYTELKNAGLKISSIALGCWKFGGGDYWGGYSNEKNSLATVDAALGAGINLFDTAESYNDGQSDLFLGRAMKGRRDKFIVSTKFYLDKLRKDDVLKTCDESLKRLQTDYIDILSPHFPSMEIPFDETFEAFDILKRQGKIRHIGLSNFGTGALGKVNAIGKSGEIAFDQLPYSLLWRAVEYGIRQKAREYNIGIICYSTLAQGLLTGTFNDPKAVPANLKVLGFFRTGDLANATFDTINAYKKLCEREGLNMAPTALAWLLAQQDVVCLLTGASNPDELTQNLECLDLHLSQHVIDEISKLTGGLKELIGNNADMWNSRADSRIY